MNIAKMYVGSEPSVPPMGFHVNPLVFNDVSSSGAVSPMTRAMPRIAAVVRPALTVGNTTMNAVRH